MGALLAECLLLREKLNTTRGMEVSGGGQRGSQSHEERKARIEEKITDRYESSVQRLSFFFFFVLAAVQYAVPFVGQQKVQCSLLL